MNQLLKECQIKKHYGRNLYSDLFQVLFRGRPAFLKLTRLDLIHEPFQDILLRQALVLDHLTHPGLIPVITTQILPGFLLVFLQFSQGSTLAEQISKRSQKFQYFSENQLVNRMLKLCQTLKFLHQKGVFVRDLSAINIFPGDKIGDLVLSKLLLSQAYPKLGHTQVPQMGYSSYSQKVDSYCLGVVLQSMMLLKVLKQFKPQLLTSGRFSARLVQICCKLCHPQQENRLTIVQAISKLQQIRQNRMDIMIRKDYNFKGMEVEVPPGRSISSNRSIKRRRQVDSPCKSISTTKYNSLGATLSIVPQEHKPKFKKGKQTFKPRSTAFDLTDYY